MTFDALAERIRRNEPVPWPVAALLNACTPVMRVGMLARKLRPVVRLDAHVVSFGNLTAGGAGKTPAVIAEAQRRIAQGAKVAVLTRGYGAQRTHAPIVAGPDDAATPDLAARIGDEPALILRRAPGVVVVRCADRTAGGREAIERGCDVLIWKGINECQE